MTSFFSLFVKAIGLIIIHLFFFTSLSAQEIDYNQLKDFDYSFTKYLIDNKYFEEAKHILNKAQKSNEPFNPYFSDTLNYLSGIISYRQKELLNSSGSLFKISATSPNYTFSRFLGAYELAHLGYYSKSISVLQNLKLSDSSEIGLQQLQLRSIKLLTDDLCEFEVLATEKIRTNYKLAEYEKKLSDLYENRKSFNPKSPVVAGLMSAAIPGSGKMYAGKIGEGVTMLLGLGILGAITYENYVKAGINNYKTITFGSLFTVFYISNIYGSVFSVKVYRDEYYKSLHNAILFNMHIPIREFYRHHFK